MTRVFGDAGKIYFSNSERPVHAIYEHGWKMNYLITFADENELRNPGI